MKLWPFEPNWKNSVNVTISYLTEIITSRAGREQRTAWRKTPRRQVEFRVTLDSDGQRQLHRFLSSEMGKMTTMRDPVRRVAAIGTALSGSTSLTVSRVPTWLQAGITLVLPHGQWTTVTAITGTVLTLTDALTADVAAGALVYLGVQGQLESLMRVSSQTNGVAELQFTFNIDPGSEPRDDGYYNAIHFENRELLIDRPNWSNPVESQYSQTYEQLDFDAGRILTYTPIAFGSYLRTSTFLRQTDTQIEGIQKFVRRQRGRAHEFLMPTWIPDFKVLSGINEGGQNILVDGIETYNQFVRDPLHKYIVVITDDGRFIPRRIINIFNVDGTQSQIRVTPLWPTTLSQNQIEMVCWLYVSRFATDDLTMEWITDQSAQTTLSIQALEALPSEITIPPYDEAAQWVLDNWGLGALGFLDQLDWIVNVRYPEITQMFMGIAPDSFDGAEEWVLTTWGTGILPYFDTFDVIVNVDYPEATNGLQFL
jgi:hypothetical protein